MRPAPIEGLRYNLSRRGANRSVTKQRIIHSDGRTLRVFLLLGIVLPYGWTRRIEPSSGRPSARVTFATQRTNYRAASHCDSNAPTGDCNHNYQANSDSGNTGARARGYTSPQPSPKHRQVNPTATPTPRVIQTGVDRVAPELGPPPPIPS